MKLQFRSMKLSESDDFSQTTTASMRFLEIPISRRIFLFSWSVKFREFRGQKSRREQLSVVRDLDFEIGVLVTGGVNEASIKTESIDSIRR